MTRFDVVDTIVFQHDSIGLKMDSPDSQHDQDPLGSALF